MLCFGVDPFSGRPPSQLRITNDDLFNAKLYGRIASKSYNTSVFLSLPRNHIAHWIPKMISVNPYDRPSVTELLFYMMNKSPEDISERYAPAGLPQMSTLVNSGFNPSDYHKTYNLPDQPCDSLAVLAAERRVVATARKAQEKLDYE